MPSFSPALIQTMRAALDEVMTKIPLEQATPGIKASLAECILKTAAAGQTLGGSSLRANSEHSFDADLNGARDSMFRDPRVVLGLLALWALIVVVWAMVGD